MQHEYNFPAGQFFYNTVIVTIVIIRKQIQGQFMYELTMNIMVGKKKPK